MAANASSMMDTPALLAMLAQPQSSGQGIDPMVAASLKQKIAAKQSAEQPTTPDQLTPNPMTTMALMGNPIPQISAEEKALQKKLLDDTQKQNVGLQGDVDQQRLLTKVRNYMLENRGRDITPALQSMYAFAGQNGAEALKAAKPDSPDELTDKLQSAIKESAGTQDKLSDNELALLKMRLQFANQKGATGAAQKQQQMVANFYQKLAKDTNPSMASGRNGLGNPYKGLLGVDKAQGILDSTDDLNKLTSQQSAELYEALANIVSNGGGTSEARLHSLVPGNAMRSFADFQQYLTSKPVAANQGAFLENLQHMLDRERDVQTSNVRQSQKDSFTGMAPYFATDPHGQMMYQQLLQARGFRPDMTYDPATSLTGYMKKARKSAGTKSVDDMTDEEVKAYMRVK